MRDSVRVSARFSPVPVAPGLQTRHRLPDEKRGGMLDRFLEGSSYWTATTPMPAFPALTTPPLVDVIVVGGGIAGITAAHLLKRAGRRVALIERTKCGAGQTARTTAHLTAVTDTPFTKLVETLGIDDARRLWDASFAAIARVRSEVRDHRINCDFAWVRGCLHAPIDQELSAARLTLSQEAAIANALGINATYADQVPGLGRPGVWFDGQARLHPLRYLSVLLDGIDGDGSYVFEHTEVDAIDTSALTVRAGHHTIAASYIVVTTHVPSLLLSGTSSIEELPPVTLATSYVLAGTTPAGSVSEGVYWEYKTSPYEYLRVDRQPHHDLVLFGGLDHVGGETAAAGDRFARLERRLAQRVPGVRIEHRWSGQVVEPADGRPYIGEIADGIFVATGFGGNGMSFGTLAGMMAADATCGIRSPWADLLDPRRGPKAVTGHWRRALAAS